MKRPASCIILLAILFSILGAPACNSLAAKKEVGKYVCLPCGSPCDTVEYDQPGTCSHCSMKLVERTTITHSNIEPREICPLLSKEGSDEVLLLDVRTPDEFEGKAPEKFGRLKGAVNIPVQELEKRMDELSAWKNKRIVVYCSHSRRSPRASYMLSQNGFKNVTNMQGGMSVWKKNVGDDLCSSGLYVDQK